MGKQQPLPADRGRGASVLAENTHWTGQTDSELPLSSPTVRNHRTGFSQFPPPSAGIALSVTLVPRTAATLPVHFSGKSVAGTPWPKKRGVPMSWLTYRVRMTLQEAPPLRGKVEKPRVRLGDIFLPLRDHRLRPGVSQPPGSSGFSESTSGVFA